MRGARRLLSVALAMVATLVVLTGCTAFFEHGTATQDAGRTAVATAHTYDVGTRLLPLRDDSRRTGATPGRELPTTLWYPATGRGPFPVVVFSHGFRSDPAAYEELLSGWASAGFVVAAPSFPLTSRNSPGVIGDVFNQPADVSFVLTQVLALGTTGGDDLDGRIDPRHVAVAGHSAGAITTIGLLDSGADSRITAAIVLAGSPQGFGTGFATPGVPTLVVHGTADDVIPPSDGAAVYAAAPGPKAFVELTGGTHSAPYDTAEDPHFPAVRAVTTDFLQWALAGQDDAAERLRTDADRPGVARLAEDRLTG